MKKIILSFCIFISLSLWDGGGGLFSQSNYSSIRTKSKWLKYTDTIQYAPNLDFVISFLYPSKLIAETTGDDIRIGDKIPDYKRTIATNDDREDAGYRFVEKWRIHIHTRGDASNYPIEYYTSYQMMDFRGDHTPVHDIGEVTEVRDTISICNSKAIRVTLSGSNKNNPYRQMIYFKKDSDTEWPILFEIINYCCAEVNFETFCNSLTIEEK